MDKTLIETPETPPADPETEPAPTAPEEPVEVPPAPKPGDATPPNEGDAE